MSDFGLRTKIERLTPDQQSRLKEFERKWMRIGLSTEPCDVEKAKIAVSDAYRNVGLEPPKIWLHARCPIEAGLMVAFLRQMLDELKKHPGECPKLGASVGASVRASVWASVGASVEASVWASVGDSVWASVRASVWDSVGASVWDSVWASVVGASVRDSVWASFGASVGASVRASVWDSFWASVGASVRASVGASVRASVFGNHEAAWLGYMDYFGEVVGITDVEKLRPIMRVAESCGWWIPYREVCVLQDRPERVLLNDRGRIHCEDGPAISYRSGLLDIFAIHGVRVPKQVVMEPETLTVEQIKGEPNAEIRRIMIDRLGVGKYAEKTKAVVVDRDFVFRFPGDESPMPRALIQLDDKSKWLLGTDGSTHRVYHMPVPEASRTCKQAHESICGRPDNAIQWQG